ncbi:MAG: hypothetical protein QOJ59_1814 [Thermomicrobiales bacterium]|jgi:hypothetical protein|nr:hypothetical protein [Thermomicrobiales bacterium]
MAPRRIAAARRALALLLIGVLLAIPAARATARAEDATPFAGSVPSADAQPAQVLIRQSLDNGQIDYPTSLLYRAYALFADPRLPADFAGGGSVGEDHALFVEARRFWSLLPKETQDLLTPFVVRPTDSRSLYFDSRPDANVPAIATESVASPAFAGGDCGEGWAAADSPRFEFKVWVHCTGDYENDMIAAISMIEGFWDREVALMGPPIPDTGSLEQGGDSRIDFYFVEDESDVLERGGGDHIEEQAFAHAAPDAPFVGRTSSGYIIVRREAIYLPAGAPVLAHEFFHTLQEAHNWEILFGFKGSPFSSDFDLLSFAEYWFVEATANWVMSYLYRDTIDPEVMTTYLHAWYLQGFQGVDVPLYLSPRQWSPEYSHIYGAYVYFLFLEQEVGPQAIADLWKKLEDVEADDFDRTLRIIDELLPFEENFRDFAVRNLNLDLQPGDPITPSYRDLDPTFPEGEPPPLNFAPGTSGKLRAQESDAAPLEYQESIPSLAAHYYSFSPGPDVSELTLDFSGLIPSDALDVELLVKIREGEWERRQLSPGETATICRDHPADDVGSFYLVLSNHDLVESTTVRGTFTIRAVDTPCA